MGNNHIRVSVSKIRLQHMDKSPIDETSLKFINFDEEQKLQSCWVLLVHVEVENSLKGYFKGTLWYKFMSNLFFIILRSLDILKCKKNIFRCEEILKIMTLTAHRFS